MSLLTKNIVSLSFFCSSIAVAQTDFPLATWNPAHSNNFTPASRIASDIRWIVLHTTEDQPGSNCSTSQNYFKNSTSGVSAHYVICLDGTVVQMVRDDDIAYHAGNWPYNQKSIGIEHERHGSENWTSAQYAASIALVDWLADRYAVNGVFPAGIGPADPVNGNGIIGHYQVPDPNNPNLGGGINHHTDPVNWNWDTYKQVFCGFHCDDSNACTNDTCGATSCQHSNLASGTTCGDQGSSECDAPDTCNSSGVCVARFKSSGTACRAANGECDLAEVCSGSSVSCPVNVFKASGASCGSSSSSGCNAPDTCDGAGVCVNRVKPSGTVCRNAANECDLAESCNGSSSSCPTNAFRPTGAACGSADSSECNLADSCDGAGNCVNRVKDSGTICREAVGECDPDEVCDGLSSACPTDEHEPDGLLCSDDFDDCTTNERCVSGVCVGFDSCSCPSNVCGDGCCVGASENLATCPSDCSDFLDLRQFMLCFSGNSLAVQGCLIFDHDLDDKITVSDLNLFLHRHYGGL